MKRLTAILTAALLTLTISLPALAEPDEPDNAESGTAGLSETESDDTESDDTESDDTESDDTESDDEESEDENPADEGSADEDSGETEDSSEQPDEADKEKELTSYRIKEAGMDISLPADMLIVTRDTEEDAPVFGELGTTKEESDKFLEENDMYLRADTSDLSGSVSVVITETEDTKEIGNLSSLNEDSLLALIDQIQENTTYSEGTKTVHNNVPFLSFRLKIEDEDSTVYGIQEYTIIEGKCVRITYQTKSEPGNDTNASVFSGILKTVSFEGAPAAAESENKDPVTVRIEEAKMEITIPSGMSVMTRDTKKDDPVYKINHTTKAEFDKNFKENDIYLKANTKDFSCSVTVVVNESEDTKKIGDLSSLSEENIQKIIDKMQEHKIYTGCARVNYNNVMFLSFTIAYENEGKKYNGLQEYTIIDGKCIKITYQTMTEEETDPNKAVFGAIMESVHFDGVDVVPQVSKEKSPSVSVSDMDIRFIYIMIAAVIGIISLMIMILVGIKYSQSKNSRKEEKLKYDDDNDETEKSTPDDEGPADNTEDDSMDIFSDTGKGKHPSIEIKPMTYDDVISAQGNFNAAQTKTPETPEKKKEPEKKAVKKVDDNKNKPKAAPEKAPVDNEPKFFIVADDKDVPQAPLKWDDIPEGALDTTVQPSLEELKNDEGPQNTESYQKAWKAAKAKKSARAETPAQKTGTPENAGTENTKTTGKKSLNTKKIKTGVAAAAVLSAKNSKTAAKDVPATESTMEIPDLKDAPEYVPITGFDTDDADDTSKQISEPDNTGAETKKQPVTNETDAHDEVKTASAETDNADGEKLSGTEAALPDENKNMPDGDEPQDMRNFFKRFSRQKNEDEQVYEDSDFYTDSSMNDPAPVVPEDEEADYDYGDVVFAGQDGQSFFSDSKAPSSSDTDTPAGTAAAAVENTILAGMISRLQSVNKEVSSDMDGNGTEDMLLNGSEETNSQDSNRNNPIELEISKASDGSLVIGAKNDANGQPMDIEIRDASHFKEDRDKEMAAMGFETASQNEIYNAWKIESDEKPFVVKTISEFEAEEADKTSASETADSETIDEKQSAVSENAPTADSEKAADGAEPSDKEKTSPKDEPLPSDKKENDDGHKGKKAEEEFFEGVKSAAPLEAGGIDPKEQKTERDENMFEKQSGIKFEHPLEKQSPIVPMQTPFTKVPRLESVNAEEYHKEYEELKKTLPKNQFYAQRFSSANITQPFVETPKPITAPAEPEQLSKNDFSDVPENTEPAFDMNDQKSITETPQNDSTFEYYTGYNETEDPFSVQDPNAELRIKDHKKKSNDSFGSKFKKSFSSFFSNDIPDE